ncbi:LysR family transcriptional regulator [Pseudomonas sp. NPDC088444]|uniref:helix-turn-helix domain-containing protein n=1 Tax=Pseudomonas sp. NPDC088444 TaxID=3364456 RepID=UPI00384CEF20
MDGDAVRLREGLLCELDLNLLLTFAVLFREGNVSRAARCLSVGQPAVSNALAKLRRHFNDPLFIRGYRTMHPTPRAIALANDILPALERLQHIAMG